MADASTEPTAAPQAESASHKDIISELIDHWHFQSFHGTALGASTELWNLVHVAKEDLKSRIAAII